jgi:MerR family redox-sensitive transcriptional activator SoxR
VTLSIGEVAHRSGVPATTLRYYEEVGLIARPSRVAGRRQYAEDVLDVLTVISAARRTGVSLAEARVLLDAVGRHGPGRAWRNLATDKRTQLLDQIYRLEQMVQLLDAITACECASLTDCASRLRADGRSLTRPRAASTPE